MPPVPKNNATKMCSGHEGHAQCTFWYQMEISDQLHTLSAFSLEEGTHSIEGLIGTIKCVTKPNISSDQTEGKMSWLAYDFIIVILA